MWSWPLPNHVPWEIPRGEHVGAFGARRKHDVHTGIDLYAPEGSAIHAVEAGRVFECGYFTGPEAGSPWWNTTQFLMVAGPSGLVLYGEIQSDLRVGDQVAQGQKIGTVMTVLKKDKGRPRSMLHLELYASGWCGGPVWWKLDEAKPEALLDPTLPLRGAWARVTGRFHRDVPPPPDTREARKVMVEWILDHPLWRYPVKLSGGLPWRDEEIPEEDRVAHMGSLQECTCFLFVYVDPTIEESKGSPGETDFRVWLETGGWMDFSVESEDYPEPEGGWTDFNRWHSCHDINLDCGGTDMEDALVNLALRVRWYYGDKGRDTDVQAPEACGGDFEDVAMVRYVTRCKDASDGFCQKCGYRMEAR